MKNQKLIIILNQIKNKIKNKRMGNDDDVTRIKRYLDEDNFKRKYVYFIKPIIDKNEKIDISEYKMFKETHIKRDFMIINSAIARGHITFDEGWELIIKMAGYDLMILNELIEKDDGE